MVEQKNTQESRQRVAGANTERDDSLYAQIAAGDEVAFQQRRRNSFLMAMMVSYMRFMLSVDAKRREYQGVFHVLGVIWGIFMSFLYLSGVLMFTILVVSYMQFPNYVQAYLKHHGILYARMETPGYIKSQIELYGLHDENKTYSIDHVHISSTFADFLNRRAKDVKINGVHLILDQTNENNLSGLMSMIFQHDTKGPKLRQNRGRLWVDSLEGSKAALVVKGKDYEIPISFSLTGVYGRETNISAYVTIDKPYLTAKGPLSIQGTQDKINWNFDIQEGSVVFPGRPREALKGKVSLNTNNMQVLSANVDLSLLFERIEKKLSIVLNQGNNEKYKGKVGMQWTDSSIPSKPVVRTQIDLGLDGVSFAPGGIVKSSNPMNLKLSTTYNSDIQVKNMSGLLNGELQCQVTEGCSYTLKRPSALKAEWLRLTVFGSTLNSVRDVRLTFAPSKDTMALLWKEGVFRFNMINQNLNFEGVQPETKVSSKLLVGHGQAQGYLNLWDKRISAALSASKINYTTPSGEVTDAVLTMEDVFKATSQVEFKSPRVILWNNEYIKAPFEMEYSRKGYSSALAVTMENKAIRLLFSGYFDNNSGAIDGRFVVPAIDMDRIKTPLHQISPLFSKNIVSVKGKMAAYGALKGNLYGSLKGPVYIALSNVGLKTNTMNVDGVNAALGIQSIRPFGTETEQEIFIGSVDSFIPVHDIDLWVRLDDKYAQLTKLTAKVLNLPVSAEPTLIPYRNVATLLYLKNPKADFSGMKQALSLKNWSIANRVRGSVLIPVEVKDLEIGVRNAEVQLTEASARYVGKAADKPKFLEKQNQLEVQSGTVTVEENNLTKQIKTTVVLDALVGSEQRKKIKKFVRETVVGPLSDIINLPKKTSAKTPAQIQEKIDQVFKMIAAMK